RIDLLLTGWTQYSGRHLRPLLIRVYLRSFAADLRGSGADALLPLFDLFDAAFDALEGVVETQIVLCGGVAQFIDLLAQRRQFVAHGGQFLPETGIALLPGAQLRHLQPRLVDVLDDLHDEAAAAENQKNGDKPDNPSGIG